jgi:hypothetical protein
LTEGLKLDEAIAILQITLDEAIECANLLADTPLRLVGDAVRRLLRVLDGVPLVQRGGEAGKYPFILVVCLVYFKFTLQSGAL